VCINTYFVPTLSSPWKDTLVVKLLGKKLGYNIMKSKLETIWDLKGGFELMDIGNSFFMIKFDGEEDKTRVINRAVKLGGQTHLGPTPI
jgi:hypothetical protein